MFSMNNFPLTIYLSNTVVLLSQIVDMSLFVQTGLLRHRVTYHAIVSTDAWPVILFLRPICLEVLCTCKYLPLH